MRVTDVCICKYAYVNTHLSGVCFIYMYIIYTHLALCVWKCVVTHATHTHSQTHTKECLSFLSGSSVISAAPWGVCPLECHTVTAEVPALYNPPPTAVAEALDSVALSPVMGLCTSASALKKPAPSHWAWQEQWGPYRPQEPPVTSSQVIYPSPGVSWTEWEASEMQRNTRERKRAHWNVC